MIGQSAVQRTRTITVGLIAATLVAVPSSSQAAGDTIVVTTTIQAAVDQADPGDTVLVPAGTYAETVAVTEPGITIRGPGDAVLDGTGLGSSSASACGPSTAHGSTGSPSTA